MKRMISVALAFLFLIGCSALAETSFSAMSDDELHALIDGARLELQRREFLADENVPVFEAEGVSLYYTGEVEFTGSTGKMLTFTAIIVNDSEKNINVRTENLAVNGWGFSPYGFSNIPAGQKKRCKLDFPTDGEIASVDEITDLVAKYSIVNADDFKDVTEVGTITVHFNAD